MKRSHISISVLVISISLLTGCKSDKGPQDLLGQGSGTAGQKDTTVASTRVKSIRGVFYNIPSALEISQLLKESGAQYSETYPSDPGNSSKYSSQKGQSVNLGIYAADLSYAGIYEQKEEAMLYLKCANQLATSLGIPNAFGESTIARIQDNMNNQDSLLNIITQDYWNTDSYLKNSDRQEISALIMAGGWIEGFYIATQIAVHSTGNKQLLNRIAEQKSSLNQLVMLVSTYPDDATTQTIKGQLKRIQDAYAGISIDNGNVKVSNDTAKNSSTLKGDEKVLMTPEQLKNLTDVTAAVRKEIIEEY